MHALRDTNIGWSKSVYNIKIGKIFHDYTEALKFLYDTSKDIATRKAYEKVILDMMYKDETSKKALTVGELRRPTFSDSSLGGNDAINCYWQFDEDDDIIMPIDRHDSSGVEGMGLVYKEMYEQYQQILWVTFGVLDMLGAVNYYKSATNVSLATLMTNGDGLNLGDFLGRLAGKALFFMFEVPFLPLKWLGYAVDFLSKPFNLYGNKFYNLKPSMILYYRMVNSVLAPLAVGLGVYGNAKNMRGGPLSNIDGQFKTAGAPRAWKHGLDAFAIMDKRGRISRAFNEYIYSDDMVKALKLKGKDRASHSGRVPASSWWNTFTESISTNMLGGSDYIGFRVEKGFTPQESVSHQTGESEIAQKLNGLAHERMDKSYTRKAILKTGNGFIDNAVESATDAMKSFISSIPFINAGTALEIVAGGSLFSLPEVYKGSSFSKTDMSITIPLRAVGADPVSIFQSIYFPLSFWIAGAFPRAVGDNAYVGPFLCQYYCKGMAASNLAIIKSLTIRRGSDEFGWSVENLPLSIDVTVNFQDLTPELYVSLMDKMFLSPFASNDNFQEYMTTLSGIGLSERMYMLPFLRRRANASMSLLWSNYLNPHLWGNRVGRSRLMRTIAAFQPVGGLSTLK